MLLRTCMYAKCDKFFPAKNFHYTPGKRMVFRWLNLSAFV